LADSGAHGPALTSARLAALLAELREVRPEILAVALSTPSGLLLGGSTAAQTLRSVAQATSPVQPDGRATGEVACATNDTNKGPRLSASGAQDEAEALAALGAGLLGAAGTPSEALLSGAPAEVLVNGPAGYLIALAAGPHAVLSALAAPTASMTLLMPDLRQAAVYFGQAVTV